MNHSKSSHENKSNSRLDSIQASTKMPGEDFISFTKFEIELPEIEGQPKMFSLKKDIPLYYDFSCFPSLFNRPLSATLSEDAFMEVDFVSLYSWENGIKTYSIENRTDLDTKLNISEVPGFEKASAVPEELEYLFDEDTKKLIFGA